MDIKDTSVYAEISECAIFTEETGKEKGDQ